MGTKTKICSIFGQIEGVVADAMVAEGIVRKIEWEDIPASVRYDGAGRQAHCALIFTDASERQFNKRVRDLRA